MPAGEGGPVTAVDRHSAVSIADILAARISEPITGTVVVSMPAALIVEIQEDLHFVEDKARDLGVEFTGAPVGTLDWVDDPDFGLIQQYEKCTIYWSAATGAHEIHGDIREKYDALNGVNLLGFPITDELMLPEGRYNQFAKNGSIYWHPSTGAMAVHGKIRDLWAARGWENSDLGYPTSDVFTTRPYDDVSHSFGVGEPVCLFQNGALSEYSVHGDWLDHATMTPDQLLDVLWHRIDTLVHQSPDNIGLHPGKGLDDVSDNAPGFWTSRNRVLRVHVDGFHDNGLVLPDTDFTLSMDLLFYTDTVVRLDPVNAPNTHLRLPTTLNFVPEARVVVAKMGSSVTANGVSSGAVASGVLKAVEDAFAQPLPVSSDAIPLDYFIGLVVLQDGSLSLWFVNSPQGRVTADLVQQAINNLP